MQFVMQKIYMCDLFNVIYFVHNLFVHILYSYFRCGYFKCSRTFSARFSQKVVSGKKPPTSKNLAAHLEILPLTPKKLVAKIATKTKKFSGKKINPIEVLEYQFYFDQSEPCT